jgi:cytidylate kinase
MIIALFGSSCVGKSTIADALGNLISAPVRHCGELVKAHASKLRILPSALSIEDHREIDARTRDLSKTKTSEFIIEGRFLNHVLVELGHIYLIRLTCDAPQRKIRFEQRVARNPMDLEERDAADRSLSDVLYGNSIPKYPDLTIDTTSLQADRVAVIIEECIREQHPQS